MAPSWPFAPEHEELRREIRAFVEAELVPHAEEWDAAESFPDSVFRRLGELGFLGVAYPEEYGGGGGDYLCNIVLAEEMARCGSGSVAMAVAVQTDMAVPPVMKFGTALQKERYLRPALAGTKIFCLGISEPDAGSDVAAIKTTATKAPDGWIVNGRKTFITNGRRADVMTLLARTRSGGGHGGLSLFIVDTATPGYVVERVLDKVGMRASDTAEVSFTDMFVADDALLGNEGEGFYSISWELQGERLIGAAAATAGAQRLLEVALDYARTRQTFGKPLIAHQAVRHSLAEMATAVESARRVVYETAWRISLGEYPVREVSIAKLLSGQVSWMVADRCLQIFGGHGYSMELPVQRAWRDSRLVRIGGGTDEVMREVIGRIEGL